MAFGFNNDYLTPRSPIDGSLLTLRVLDISDNLIFYAPTPPLGYCLIFIQDYKFNLDGSYEPFNGYLNRLTSDGLRFYKYIRLTDLLRPSCALPPNADLSNIGDDVRHGFMGAFTFTVQTYNSDDEIVDTYNQPITLFFNGSTGGKGELIRGHKIPLLLTARPYITDYIIYDKTNIAAAFKVYNTDNEIEIEVNGSTYESLPNYIKLGGSDGKSINNNDDIIINNIKYITGLTSGEADSYYLNIVDSCNKTAVWFVNRFGVWEQCVFDSLPYIKEVKQSETIGAIEQLPFVEFQNRYKRYSYQRTMQRGTLVGLFSSDETKWLTDILTSEYITIWFESFQSPRHAIVLNQEIEHMTGEKKAMQLDFEFIDHITYK